MHTRNKRIMTKKIKPSPAAARTSLKQGKRRGLLLVITGKGKGKTTTALGIVLRAAGHDMRICIIQFVKGTRGTGEIAGLRKLPTVEFHRAGTGFCGIQGDSLPYSRHKADAQHGLSLARRKMRSGKYDLVVLDEINIAVALGLISRRQILSLIDTRPPQLHLVLTGRDAMPEVIERADTVTEMKEVKHAWHQGISPEEGIDF